MTLYPCKFDEFELDAARFQLRRSGQILKLERIPMELLILLVEKDGNMVSRQEIVERLWGKDVFVDTEHGINTAIRKIRSVLKDHPEQPRFVQTVTGKGYRFIGEKVSGTIVSGIIDGPDSQNPAGYATLNSIPANDALASVSRASVSPAPSHSAPSQPSVKQKARQFLRNYRRSLGLLALVSLILIAYLGWKRAHPGAPQEAKPVMMAVLPFENLSKDPDQDYFSDGLTEEVITQLGTLSPERLGVIARTTSMAYRHTQKSVEQIGHELGVDYVLESSIRRDGNQVRISSQLIRVRDQIHVWASSYDREVSHSIALQEELANAVAEQVQVRITSTRRPRAGPPLDEQANEAYLRGRYFWNQITIDGYRKAIDYFQDAIRRDPNFAEAYSGLSDSYFFLAVTDSIPSAEGESKALEAARRAVALDDSSPESHLSLADALFGQWNWPEAETGFRRAIALNPSYSPARRIYAAFLAAQRRPKEARQQIEAAMRLDPLCLPNNAEVVRTLYYARDYDGAIQRGQKALQLDPNFARTHFWLGRVYAQKRMYLEAVSEADKVLQALPDSNLALTELAYSLGVAGRRTEARKLLKRLEQRSVNTFVPAYDLAVIHVGLDENNQAMGLLEKAYTEHDWALLVFAAEPRLDPLRGDSRYRELSTKLGLTFHVE